MLVLVVTAGWVPVRMAILFGGKAKTVPAHRMENVESFLPFVAGEDVGSGIAGYVANVKACSRRIGKHVKNVVFRF